MLLLTFALAQLPAVAQAEEAGWPNFTVQPGLQMWTPLYAGNDGSLRPQSTIGGLIKVNYAFTDNLGAHVRGVYGGNKTTDHIPSVDRSFNAWAAGLGLDFHASIGDRVQWVNTMGLAYGQNTATVDELEQPSVTTLGAYFVTGLDITVMGPMGVWMDWGCQVVGPSFATIPETAGGTEEFEASSWHINALGAGGMRFAF